MPRGVDFPLYIPPSCQDVEKLIETFRPEAAVELLRKKVQFGNHQAAALLAYLHLRGAAPREGFEGAYKKCKEAAEAGDSYAEFVVSLIHQAAGRHVEALRWLRKASIQLFPPALSHMGRLMTFGIGYPQPERASALRMYWLALKRFHVPTLALVSRNLMGSRNPLTWVLGALLAPFAVIVLAINFQLAPFKVTSFGHISTERPLFTRKKTPDPR